ncbi:MAG TPA: hypothetical protein VN675_02660 [Burkholderiales bacterium]|nr:hypothetical protein [Burkholderiales bacterium]
MSKRNLLLAALGAALLAPLALELAVRFSGYSAPFWYRPDAQLGWTLRPGTQGWFTKEGRTFVRINDAGFRDRDHSLDKPDDVFRIAVLGDEHSEAMPVELHETWWSLLGHQLDGCSVAGGKRVEMLNFGVSSYGTAQELVMLETVAMRYRPDLVLLQFTPDNDPQNNSFALAVDKERPFYRLEGGKLRIDGSFNSTAKYARHAAPSHEIARKIGDRSRAVQWLSMLPEEKHRPGVQKALLGPPPNELWEDAWKISEALILRMDDYSRRNGAKFAIISVSGGYGGERIAALAAKNRLQFVSLDLKAEGQRRAAELTASALCGSRETRLRSE